MATTNRWDVSQAALPYVLCAAYTIAVPGVASLRRRV